MNKRRIAWIVGPVLILAVLAALLLEQALPFGVLFFETIDQYDGITNLDNTNLEILIIDAIDEVKNTGSGTKFSPEITQRLKNIDYNRYFVICVFSGPKFISSRRDSTVNGMNIRYILRQGNEIIVQTAFSLEDFEIKRISGPVNKRLFYHLVRVPKGQLSGTYRFILRSETGETAEATHTIP